MILVQANYWYRKNVVGFIALTAMMLSLAGSCLAADYVGIQIYPEHVGVFTTVGKQQFVAYGIDQDFGRVNITEQVDWISSDENIVTIDETGMAVVADGKTSGQVKISCSYPKTGGDSDIGPAVNLLLLDSSGQGQD